MSKRTGLLLGLALVAAIVALTRTADAQNGKPPTIKEIMAKLNKGPNSMCPTLGKDLRAEPVKWDDVQKEAKDFVTWAEALGKNTPKRGDKAHWDKLTASYLESAKALEAAAEKMDKTAAQSAHARLADMKNCNACHNAHRN